MGLGSSYVANSNTEEDPQPDLKHERRRPTRPVKKAHSFPKVKETTAPIFVKPGSVQPKTLNGDVKMPETKDDDEDVDFISQSLPAIREEAKLVLEKFLKRSLSQNDASPMRQVLLGPQLEVITEGQTAVSENGTHHSKHGVKPKKKHVQSKNGALKVRPSFDRSDSYMAAAKKSVIDSIQRHEEQNNEGEWKPKVRNKANTVSSADYKDNKRSSGVRYPKRASSQKGDGATTTPISPSSTIMSSISTELVDRKDSFSSRQDSSSDDDGDSLKQRKKKNVFTRAKERLRMSFRKRELNAREKSLRRQSKHSSPKHPVVAAEAPVINVTKATPSPDKSSSGSQPNSSPSTGDILDTIALPTPSSRGSIDRSGSNEPSIETEQSGRRDFNGEGSYTPNTPSPSSSKKFGVKTGSESPKSSSRYSVSPIPRGQDHDSKPSLWKWFKNSKLGLKRKSSKEKGKSKSAEVLSQFTVSDTRLNQVNQVNGSGEIKRTSSLGRYEGMRIQQNMTVESRTSSVGATDGYKYKYTFKKSDEIIVAHGPSKEGVDRDGQEEPKRKGSIREELKRTFSMSKGDNIGIQKKHSFRGRCSYVDRDNLKLDLVPCRPRPSGGGGLPSNVVVDASPDEKPVLTPSQKPHSERNQAEKDEIYDKIAEKLASIADGIGSTPLRPGGPSPPRQRATLAVDHPSSPLGAAGGYDDATLEKLIANHLRIEGDKIAEDLVDGSATQEALMEYFKTMSYKKFKRVARKYTTNSEPNFNELAQLFHLARGAVQLVGAGGSAVNNIKDYTLNYFVDYFAGWIIGKGGWDSVIEETDDEPDDGPPL